MAEVLNLPARLDPGFLLTVVDVDPLRASLRATGELDLAARQPLAVLLQQQLVAGRGIIRVDLSEVTFLDCSCVGVLVGAHRRCLEVQGLLVLVDLDPRIARILTVTGLADILFLEPTLARPSRPLAS